MAYTAQQLKHFKSRIGELNDQAVRKARSSVSSFKDANRPKEPEGLSKAGYHIRSAIFDGEKSRRQFETVATIRPEVLQYLKDSAEYEKRAGSLSDAVSTFQESINAVATSVIDGVILSTTELKDGLDIFQKAIDTKLNALEVSLKKLVAAKPATVRKPRTAAKKTVTK